MKKEFKGPNRNSGKGSNRRPEDFRKVQKHWDEINWGRPTRIATTKWCTYCSKWGHSSKYCPKLELK